MGAKENELGAYYQAQIEELEKQIAALREELVSLRRKEEEDRLEYEEEKRGFDGERASWLEEKKVLEHRHTLDHRANKTNLEQQLKSQEEVWCKQKRAVELQAAKKEQDP